LQDGLRALLPNVNVSFGGNNPQQQQQFGLAASNGLQNSFHNFGQLERMQQQTGTSSKFLTLFFPVLRSGSYYIFSRRTYKGRQCFRSRPE